jgi:hypothetical protein
LKAARHFSTSGITKKQEGAKMNNMLESNAFERIMEIIIADGFSGMDQVMSILINEAMKTERSGGGRPMSVPPGVQDMPAAISQSM